MDRRPLLFLASSALMSVWVMRSGYATPPGFDCSKANAALAVAICNSEILSSLDLRFSDAYQALRQQVGSQGAGEVFQEAVKFQSFVVGVCNLPADLVGYNSAPYDVCIQNLYLQQRAAWVNRLSSPGREETDLSAQDLLDAQGKLAALGYLPAGSQIDGVYGPSTRAAIVSFQLAKGLAQTGFLDQETFNALSQISPSPNLPAIPLPASQANPSAEQLAIAKAEAAKAQAEADKAQAEATKAQAEAAAQIALTQRQEAQAEAEAAAEAAAKQKALDQAKALQDAQGTSP